MDLTARPTSTIRRSVLEEAARQNTGRTLENLTWKKGSRKGRLGEREIWESSMASHLAL